LSIPYAIAGIVKTMYFLYMENLLTININKYQILFIFWNIFLALVPCWIAYFMSKANKIKRLGLPFIVLFLLWLFMLPNTAYLFFMVRHVVDYCTDLNAYRVCYTGGSWIPLFFFTYALIGLPTFYYAIKKMTNLVSKTYCKMCKKAFPIVIIPITSIGLMFGLYERFNSWDLLTRPWEILHVTTSYFQSPIMLTDFIIFTILLYVIYYVTDFFVNVIQND